MGRGSAVFLFLECFFSVIVLYGHMEILPISFVRTKETGKAQRKTAARRCMA